MIDGGSTLSMKVIILKFTSVLVRVAQQKL